MNQIEAMSELHAIQQQISNINDQVEKVGEEVAKQTNNISTILILLTGNKIDRDDKGIVGKINSIEKRVETLEKWKDRVFWIVIGMSFPAGVGTWELLSQLLKP